MGLCLSVPKKSPKLDERSRLKPKKRKVDKAVIGLPSNFQHIAHGGADGSTTHPGTTKSQLDALKNKMDDFARLLDDFDDPTSPADPSSESSDNLLAPENAQSSRSSHAPLPTDTNVVNSKTFSSPPNEASTSNHETSPVTSKTLPINSSLESRKSARDTFETNSKDNLTKLDDKFKTSKTTPEFSYLELPLEFESGEKPAFSEDVVDLLQNPSKSNLTEDPVASPSTPTPVTSAVSKASDAAEPLLEGVVKSDSPIESPVPTFS